MDEYNISYTKRSDTKKKTWSSREGFFKAFKEKLLQKL